MIKERAAFHTLGCKVNQSETEGMQALFRKAGYEIVDFEDEADVYLIHTCTVTHSGDRKSRQMIRKAIKNNDKAIIVVSGCYAQVAPEEIIKIPGVDLIIGTQDREQVVELVQKSSKNRKPINKVGDIFQAKIFEDLPLEETERVRGFVKIQEGCQNFCTYCIIPFARGPLRSRQPESVLEEVKKLISSGYKEIVLSGICTGAYGKDLEEDIDLNWLLQELAKIPNLERVRISSLDPNDFTPELIETLTINKVFCPHLHISLQSGSDSVLKRMGRKYNSLEFANLINKLREFNPKIAITTDIMVGFPGETEEEHEQSLEFVKELQLADLHVFRYSPRQGTRAAKFPDQLPMKIKETRSNEFIALGKELAKDYGEQFLGQTVAVLAERKMENFWEGHTANYLKVRFSSDKELRNKLVSVRLKEMKKDYIIGILEEEN